MAGTVDEATADAPSDDDEVGGSGPPVGRRSPFAGRSPRARWIVGVVAAVALLGLGFAGGLVWPVLSAPGTDSVEAGFARDMSTHHRQAVHMAMIEYDKGADPTIRRLAYDVATTQQYQVGQMEGWLREWGQPVTSSSAPMAWVKDGRSMLQSDGRMPGLASRDELAKLEASSGKDADVLFLQLMLRHHIGGVHMIDAALAGTDDKWVHPLAEQMHTMQQGEIEAMRDLLQAQGAKPL